MDTHVLYVDQMGFFPTSVEMVYDANRNRDDTTNGTYSNISANDLHVFQNIYSNGLPGICENNIKKISSRDDDKNAENSMHDDHIIRFNKQARQ